MTEIGERFDCFGSTCAALVIGEGELGSAGEAVALARRLLESWHVRFSRFREDSELSRVNASEGWEVPVSPLMARLAQAVHVAGSLTGGLVDGTLVEALERSGYDGELDRPVPLPHALSLAPPRRPARGASAAAWSSIEVDLPHRTITRPPGVKLDSGGLAKGLFADVLAARLRDHAGFAINCAGDLFVGGSRAIVRPVEVESPFDAGRTLHTFEVTEAGVATSGIGRRSWLDRDGRPGHHLLDPSTGSPAFTGIVQVTALAPSALMAEIHAKAAILSGPYEAPSWLPRGGLIVYDDGSHELIEPPSPSSGLEWPQVELKRAASSEPPVASPSL